MRSISSTTGTENFNLAKWLEGKLKPLSANNTISDAFEFADEIQYVPMNEEDILFSYDVTDFFTNVFLSETKLFTTIGLIFKPMILILRERINSINSPTTVFIRNIATKPEKNIDDGKTIRIALPFKDQIVGNAVRRQLRDLSNNTAVTLPAANFVRRKLEKDAEYC